MRPTDGGLPLFFFDLRVDDEDQGTALREDLVGVEDGLVHIDVPREIPDLELDERAVRDVCQPKFIGVRYLSIYLFLSTRYLSIIYLPKCL